MFSSNEVLQAKKGNNRILKRIMFFITTLTCLWTAVYVMICAWLFLFALSREVKGSLAIKMFVLKS